MHQIIFFVVLLVPQFQCQDRRVLSGYTREAPTWNWGQRLAAKAYVTEPNKSQKKLISHRPFLPFSDVGASAGPSPRKDGTIKSRNTHDTLKPGYVTNGLEEGFTTLDVIQKEANRHGSLFPLKIKGNLGGLDPKEVFYADDDLLIIKGGGFGNAIYKESHEELNSVDDIDPTAWSVKNPPSLDEEYNGNIATIIAPPKKYQNWRGGGHPPASTMHSPLSLFLPANALTPQESKTIYRVNKPYPYPMMPLLNTYFLPPIQTIALYMSLKMPRPYPNYPSFGNLVNTQNKILSFYKKTQQPAIPSQNYLIKDKKPPTYLGDTNVNFLDPERSINPDAEVISKPRPLKKSNTYLIKDKKPPTYLGDTNVNFLDPGRSINPDAEVISKP